MLIFRRFTDTDYKNNIKSKKIFFHISKPEKNLSNFSNVDNQSSMTPRETRFGPKYSESLDLSIRVIKIGGHRQVITDLSQRYPNLACTFNPPYLRLYESYRKSDQYKEYSFLATLAIQTVKNNINNKKIFSTFFKSPSMKFWKNFQI